MKRSFFSRQEILEKLGPGIKAQSLITRLRALKIEPSGYLDAGPTKVAVYNPSDVARLEADLKARPIAGRGWPRGKPRKEGKKPRA